MNHFKTFNDFINESVNEGIKYKNVFDADLEEIGSYMTDGEDSSPEDLKKLGEEALKNAKPFPLTGKIKTDAPKYIKYLVDQFKRAGIVLDDAKAIVHSPNFGNEIEIPVVGGDSVGLFLQTYLDYAEMASNGSGFISVASFANNEFGTLDTIMDDLNNFGQFVKAAEELKQYMATKGLENK